jgi:hypothetical protein
MGLSLPPFTIPAPTNQKRPRGGPLLECIAKDFIDWFAQLPFFCEFTNTRLVRQNDPAGLNQFLLARRLELLEGRLVYGVLGLELGDLNLHEPGFCVIQGFMRLEVAAHEFRIEGGAVHPLQGLAFAGTLSRPRPDNLFPYLYLCGQQPLGISEALDLVRPNLLIQVAAYVWRQKVIFHRSLPVAV